MCVASTRHRFSIVDVYSGLERVDDPTVYLCAVIAGAGYDRSASPNSTSSRMPAHGEWNTEKQTRSKNRHAQLKRGVFSTALRIDSAEHQI